MCLVSAKSASSFWAAVFERVSVSFTERIGASENFGV